jgi:creatinine amidohydrolase/Fe(II)-dependent formamide hydrolase-like protein
MRYPGTITVPADVYRKVLESAARSLRQAGFRTIVFLGDHGDYQKDNEAVARRLDLEWAAGKIRVVAITEYYRAATDGFARNLRERGYSPQEIGLHAGLADTSLALAVDPGLVRADAQRTASGTALAGVTGDPRRASADLGRTGVDTTETVAAIRKATEKR